MIEDNILSIDTDKYLGKYMNPTTETDEYELQVKKDYCNYVDTVDADITIDPVEKRALLDERFEVMDRELNHVENWKKRCFVLTELQKFDMKECFETNYSQYERTLNNRLESPLPREKILCEMYNNLIYVDSMLYMDIDGTILDGKMVSDYKKVAKYLSLIKFAQYLNEEIKKEDEINTMDIAKLKSSDKPLTHPQKIILLKKLGFFALKDIVNMNTRQRDKIISSLINEDETNTRKYINGLTTKASAGNFNPYKNKNNEDIVNELIN